MAKLIILEEQKSKEFTLVDPITTIGRVPEATITIQEKRSSKLHCQIIQQEEEFFLIDLASSNGTRLNGKKIQKEPLKHEDEIRIGELKLIFQNLELEEEDVPILAVSSSPKSSSSENNQIRLVEEKEISVPKKNKTRISQSSQKAVSKASWFSREDWPSLVSFAFAVAFLCWMISLSGPQKARPEEKNSLVKNASFERVYNSSPQDWEFSGSLPAKVSVYEEDTNSHHNVLKIQNKKGKADSYCTAVSRKIPIKGSATYRAEVQAKVKGELAGLWLSYYKKEEPYNSWNEFQLISKGKTKTKNGNWQKISLETFPPSGFTHLDLGLVVFGSKSSAVFDEVQFKETKVADSFPKIYNLDDLTLAVFPKGRWEVRWQGKLILSQAEVWIHSKEAQFCQSQLRIRTVNHSIRRFDLLGEIFDFSGNSWYPFTLKIHRTSAKILFEYNLSPQWVEDPYFSYLKIYQDFDVALWLEGEKQAGNFPATPDIKELHFSTTSNAENYLLLKFKDPIMVFGSKELLKRRNLLEIYPNKFHIEFELDLPDTQRNEVIHYWITGNSQFQRKNFGIAYLAYQEVLKAAPPKSSKYKRSQEKIKEIKWQSDQDLSEFQRKLTRYQKKPSGNEKEKLTKEISHLIRRYESSPLADKFKQHLPKLDLKTEQKPDKLPDDTTPKKEKDPSNNPTAQKLFQLGMKAFRTRKFFKAKIYFENLMKDHDPKGYWTNKLQKTMTDLDFEINNLISNEEH